MGRVDPFSWLGCPQFHFLGYYCGLCLLDMYFVCGIGDELYNYFIMELVWVVRLGCGG